MAAIAMILLLAEEKIEKRDSSVEMSHCGFTHMHLKKDKHNEKEFDT